MEKMEDIVIVGAGIAGLATSLGLHRLGIKSLVLESADSLRTTGFALGIWTNAWKAIDALAIGDILRPKHTKLNGIMMTSTKSGITTSELSFRSAADNIHSQDEHEVRCVNRKVLLETLVNELPTGTIRYSSKVVNIETDGYFKSIHLDDGTLLKTKVLIGCDGVNSVVAKFLGFNKPSSVGRSAVRATVTFEDGHGFEPKSMHFFGKGIRYGITPCDDYGVYWFFTFNSLQAENDPTKLKQFIVRNLGEVPNKIKEVFEKSKVENMVCSSLRFRHPWEVLLGNISKDNVCVAGDALHPMTPDIGQGGCAALEDSVVLARVLGEALKDGGDRDRDRENEHLRIKKGLEKFARERRWRSFDLMSTSYMVGLMQQSDRVVLNFIRDKIMGKLMAGNGMLKKATFDCGSLIAASPPS